MIKQNKKGFFLSETMVVIAVVAVTLLSVFKIFSSVYSNFQQSENYDTVNAITAIANVQKYFESIEDIDTTALSETNPYIDLTTNSKYDSDYYNRLKEEFEIEKVYLIDLEHTLNGTGKDDFYVTLRKYIKTLKNVNGIVLVIVTGNNEFAYSKIENFGDVALVGDKDNEYAVYIPKNGEFIEPGYINWSGDAPTTTWEDGKTLDTSKAGTYYLHYDFNGYILRRKIVVGSFEGVTYLNHLYDTVAAQNGLIVDDTEDENLRYAGSNDAVKNYVEFNNELWRIIGVFDVASEEGGTKLPRIKLVRYEAFSDENGEVLLMSWDSSAEDVNGGYGVNQWGEVKDASGNITYEGADLMRLLNGYYLGVEGETCIYCNAGKQETCPTTNDCSGSVTPLSLSARNMIDNAEWYLGAKEYNDTMILQDMYEAERGTQGGNILCEEGTAICTDSVVRTTRWVGSVGLIYPSDYAYASNDENCASDIFGLNSTCEISNWLQPYVDYFWTITPANYTKGINTSYALNSVGSVAHYGAYTQHAVRPSVYLKSNIEITSGQGTKTNPYKLSL